MVAMGIFNKFTLFFRFNACLKYWKERIELVPRTPSMHCFHHSSFQNNVFDPRKSGNSFAKIGVSMKICKTWGRLGGQLPSTLLMSLSMYIIKLSFDCNFFIYFTVQLKLLILVIVLIKKIFYFLFV